ncbi:MAG: hypothetical protein ACRD4A_13280 [Candidatus Acidiferrales bacterium]
MSNHEGGGCCGKRWSEWSVRVRVGVIVAAIILAPGLLALLAAITMWLWNWLMPTIFNLPTIGFWQAVGILLLAQILFKGGHVRRTGRSSWKKARIRAQMREEGPEAGAE